MIYRSIATALLLTNGVFSSARSNPRRDTAGRLVASSDSMEYQRPRGKAMGYGTCNTRAGAHDHMMANTDIHAMIEGMSLCKRSGHTGNVYPSKDAAQAAIKKDLKRFKKCFEQYKAENDTLSEAFIFNIIAKAEIDPTILGEYLGEAEQEEVMVKFLRHCMDFEDQQVDQALRQTMDLFYIPGEGQKVDRMCEAFAQVYVEHNYDGFWSDSSATNQEAQDDVYRIAYLLMMLNTELHNPNMKGKGTMNRDVFVNRVNTECIADKTQKPSFVREQNLREMFYRIKSGEIRKEYDNYVIDPNAESEERSVFNVTR